MVLWRRAKAARCHSFSLGPRFTAPSAGLVARNSRRRGDSLVYTRKRMSVSATIFASAIPPAHGLYLTRQSEVLRSHGSMNDRAECASGGDVMRNLRCGIPTVQPPPAPCANGRATALCCPYAPLCPVASTWEGWVVTDAGFHGAADCFDIFQQRPGTRDSGAQCV